MSAAMSALGSARSIDDFSKINYPESIKSPRSELISDVKDGRYRYDRDFLMQFMNVYKEKPKDLPPLGQIGMEPARGGPNRRASGIGGGAAMGRGGAAGLGIGVGGAFGKGAPAKSSEERFAQSQSGARAGGMGNFGGPMGSFNMGGRTQPLSRGGSGSSGLPSRDMMGRTTSKRGGRKPESGRAPHMAPGGTIPLSEVAPLEHSENRWMPQVAAGRAGQLKADSPELTQRKVKALLNKLTLDNFDSISGQILDWANKSVDESDGRTLRQVIALVFEKATDEAAWSSMYAKLCARLQYELSPEVKDDSLKTADGKPTAGGALFRKYLLNRCQEDFERGWAVREATAAAAKSKEADDKAKKASNEQAEAEVKAAEERGEKREQEQGEPEVLSEEYYAAQKAKRRGLGLVRFIGELFKLSMLSDRIMHTCLASLLGNVTDPEEEDVESLCKLLTTVGKLLDQHEKGKGRMDIYFVRMQEMTDNDTLNSRMRFMILVSRYRDVQSECVLSPLSPSTGRRRAAAERLDPETRHCCAQDYRRGPRRRCAAEAKGRAGVGDAGARWTNVPRRLEERCSARRS